MISPMGSFHVFHFHVVSEIHDTYIATHTDILRKCLIVLYGKDAAGFSSRRPTGSNSSIGSTFCSL